MVQVVKHWSHYLFQKEFILFTDHDALRYLTSQDKISARHAFWQAYLQQFTIVLKQFILVKIRQFKKLKFHLISSLSDLIKQSPVYLEVRTKRVVWSPRKSIQIIKANNLILLSSTYKTKFHTNTNPTPIYSIAFCLA